MKRRGGLALVIAAVVLVALPAMASGAARIVKGKTSQDRQAYVRVTDEGKVTRVGVRYRADCRKPRYRVRAGIYWRDTPKPGRGFERSGETFTDGGRHRVRQRRFRAVVDSKMSGAPVASGGWAGTFSVVVRVKNRRGKTIDVCKTRQQSWRVGAAAG